MEKKMHSTPHDKFFHKHIVKIKAKSSELLKNKEDMGGKSNRKKWNKEANKALRESDGIAKGILSRGPICL